MASSSERDGVGVRVGTIDGEREATRSMLGVEGRRDDAREGLGECLGEGIGVGVAPWFSCVGAAGSTEGSAFWKTALGGQACKAGPDGTSSACTSCG